MKYAIIISAFFLGSAAFGQEKSGASKEPRDAKKVEQKTEKKERPSAEERAKRLTDRMTKELVLTADQTTKIASVNLEAAKKNDEVRANKTLTKEARKAAIKSNYESRKAQYKTIFTAEQFAKYEAKEKERIAKREAKKAEMKGKKGGKKGSAQPATEDSEDEDEL